jgi:hypothetical protein
MTSTSWDFGRPDASYQLVDRQYMPDHGLIHPPRGSIMKPNSVLALIVHARRTDNLSLELDSVIIKPNKLANREKFAEIHDGFP